ncbi:hypothetical protein M5689_006917 [Euphorbia peplus]|nr:hypothetical protein M5689_006917 [Euphorbia peplus]
MIPDEKAKGAVPQHPHYTPNSYRAENEDAKAVLFANPKDLDEHCEPPQLAMTLFCPTHIQCFLRAHATAAILTTPTVALFESTVLNQPKNFCFQLNDLSLSLK